MKENDECSNLKNKYFQSYPISGLLSNNIDKSNQELKRILKDYIESEDLLYYYIVNTLDFQDGKILQKGSAPNFQGDVISLCACKHWMRTFQNIRETDNLWITGLTGKNLISQNEGNYLYYLMRVEKKYKSHHDAWKNLPEKVKNNKNASKNKFGDIIEPKSNIIDKYDSHSYKNPVKEHPHNKKDKTGNYAWYKDVTQYYKKPFVLLFGDPKYSFIWTKPRIKWSSKNLITEGQRKIIMKEFFNKLNNKQN